MTRQAQFKAELFELLRKYEVEMSVEERFGGYDPVVVGINFYSSKWWSTSFTTAEMIDLTVGTWENGK